MVIVSRHFESNLVFHDSHMCWRRKNTQQQRFSQQTNMDEQENMDGIHIFPCSSIFKLIKISKVVFHKTKYGWARKYWSHPYVVTHPYLFSSKITVPCFVDDLWQVGRAPPIVSYPDQFYLFFNDLRWNEIAWHGNLDQIRWTWTKLKGLAQNWMDLD